MSANKLQMSPFKNELTHQTEILKPADVKKYDKWSV